MTPAKPSPMPSGRGIVWWLAMWQLPARSASRTHQARGDTTITPVRARGWTGPIRAQSICLWAQLAGKPPWLANSPGVWNARVDNGYSSFSWSGEQADRLLCLMHDALIEIMAGSNCDNTIPTVQSVGPVEMGLSLFSFVLLPFCISLTDISPESIIPTWLRSSGRTWGAKSEALALGDILYGKVNSSGRLVDTIARKMFDYACPYIVKESQQFPQINYAEGISIDYRNFEKQGKDPLFGSPKQTCPAPYKPQSNMSPSSRHLRSKTTTVRRNRDLTALITNARWVGESVNGAAGFWVYGVARWGEENGLVVSYKDISYWSVEGQT